MSTTAWKSGSEKLMRTAPMKRRGSRIRAEYWVRSPWPHMIRYEAHIATSTSAALETIWTLGSKRWIVALAMKSPLVSKSLVLRTKSNQTLSRSPTLSLSRRTTMLEGVLERREYVEDFAQNDEQRLDLTEQLVHASTSEFGTELVRIVDQRAGDLDSDRPDHDALDPLLGRQGRLGFHRGDLPDEREDEGQSPDRPDQRLADVNPSGDEGGDRRDVGFRGEKVHVSLLLFLTEARSRAGRWEPSPLREGRPPRIEPHPSAQKRTDLGAYVLWTWSSDRVASPSSGP